MITLLLIIPVFGILVLIPMNSVVKMKQIALATSMLNFIVSMVLWL